MTIKAKTDDVETPAVEQKPDALTPLAAPTNPTEGGSYIRKPSGSLVKQEG